MTNLGQNDSGDFDQLSLHGIDFGEDYTKDYGIEPTNLEGVYMDYNQLGLVPQGMGGADFGNTDPDFGVIPQGMSGHYQQLGHSQYQQLGMLDQTITLPLVGPVSYLQLLMGATVATLAGHYFGLYKLPIPIPQMK